MRTAAVIVLFYPDQKRLSLVVEAVRSQVQEIIVMDNTPDIIQPVVDCLSGTGIEYHALGMNVGIAEAQNRGIAIALTKGYDFILFLDQDSVPQEGLVSTLLSSWDFLESKREKVAVIGPGIKDSAEAKTYRARIAKGKAIGDGLVKVPQVISSGSLIRSDRWDIVGFYESGLFIDGVDFEWCWRAKKKGLHCFRNDKIFLYHQFGLEDHKFLGIEAPVPTPKRCYYLYRNYLLLLRRSYVPLYWKVSYFIKFILRLPYYSFFLKSGYAYFRNIVQGIGDGLKVHYGEPAQ